MMMTSSPPPQRKIEDLQVGDNLPELVKRPTTIMLFRFSAVTWNAHRVHYDESFARSDSHPDVLVQATMHGAFLLQMLRNFAGSKGEITEIDYQNRSRALAGDTLTCGGRITAIEVETGIVDCVIWERNQEDRDCVLGSARLKLPRTENKV